MNESLQFHDANDPFGFDAANNSNNNNGRSRSRASSDDGIVMQPRSDSALGFKPIAAPGWKKFGVNGDGGSGGGGGVNTSGGGASAKSVGGNGAKEGATSRDIDANGAHPSNASSSSQQKAPQRRSTTSSALLGAAPGLTTPDPHYIFAKIAEALAQINEERKNIERQRQQLEVDQVSHCRIFLSKEIVLFDLIGSILNFTVSLFLFLRSQNSGFWILLSSIFS